MSRKGLQRVDSARSKLIVSALLLFLAAYLFLSPWDKESQLNELMGHRESTPFSSALGAVVVDRFLFALVILGCALLAFKKPKIAFGACSVVAVIFVVWTLIDIVSITQAFAITKNPDRPFLEQATYAKNLSGLLLPTIGCIAVGVFLLAFSVPAFKAARQLEGDVVPVVASGNYGSLVAKTVQPKQNQPTPSGNPTPPKPQ